MLYIKAITIFNSKLSIFDSDIGGTATYLQYYIVGSTGLIVPSALK